MTSGSTCPQNLRSDACPKGGHTLRLVTATERRQHTWRYIWKTRRMQLVGGALGVVAVVMAVALIPRLRPPPAVLPTPGDWLSWQQNLQMIFGFATMLVAGLVWYNGASLTAFRSVDITQVGNRESPEVTREVADSGHGC